MRMKNVPPIMNYKRQLKYQSPIREPKINTDLCLIFIFIKPSKENKIFVLGHLESSAN